MPIIGAKGSPSSQGFGQFAQSGTVTYIEDVFSTYLYKGNDSTQTITNDIDLSGKGGLVWIKSRNNPGTYQHVLTDTNRGIGWYLQTNGTNAQVDESSRGLTAFNTNGFTIGNWGAINGLTGGLGDFASWTFRKQPKFFDVVTYTGNGGTQNISHSLGSTPGCIIIKCSSSTGNWPTYHRSTSSGYYLYLNGTGAQSTASAATFFGNNTTTVAPTSTQFTIGSSTQLNTNGETFVAYIFAHDAGGFGLTGTDNVISCGSWTGTGSAQDVTLGYEPQFLIIKNATTGATNWVMLDNMRGLPVGANDAYLKPNLSDAEVATSNFVDPTATGFRTILSTMNTNGNLYIYIAIRRGPMKVPTSGTSVFEPLSRNGTGTNVTISSSGVGPVDMIMADSRNVTNGMRMWDRLRGPDKRIATYSTDQEFSTAGIVTGFDSMTGVRVYDPSSEFINTNSVASPYINYMFKRAPSFFDEVCYTGTGVAGRTVAHNLTVIPEMMIVKDRSIADSWFVYAASQGATKFLELQLADAVQTSAVAWNNTTPTATVFSTGTSTNYNGDTYVAYLFATCAGVSKVGSYTGTGATQTISCGFTGGARWVMVKRTNSTGDWYVWDTARGMVSGTNPSLKLNSNVAEVNANSIYTTTGGFQIISTAAGINASGGTYIFLAIA